MSEEKKNEKKPDPPSWLERLLIGIGFKPGQARTVQWLALALFLGILFLSASDLFGLETGAPSADRPPDATLVTGLAPGGEDELTRMERGIARELEEKLSWIQGAGEVRVMVSLEAGPTIEVVKNTSTDQSVTTEKASDSSTRETETTNTRHDHVFYREGTAERPVVARTSRPQIAGVLIVAEGARDARIRARLLDAAMVALRVPANRIEVVPADRGE